MKNNSHIMENSITPSICPTPKYPQVRKIPTSESFIKNCQYREREKIWFGF